MTSSLGAHSSCAGGASLGRRAPGVVCDGPHLPWRAAVAYEHTDTGLVAELRGGCGGGALGDARRRSAARWAARWAARRGRLAGARGSRDRARDPYNEIPHLTRGFV